jgi:GNAT superfamily N-acetyltransferase
VNWTRGKYHLTDDRRRLDFDAICRLLDKTYWAKGRPRAVMRRALRHSFCLALLHDRRLVGFARAVTDHTTFAWICDVVIDPDHRGRGLGRWLVERLIHHPQLQTRSQVLATRDAHTLYTRFGFRRREYLKRKPESAPTPRCRARPSAPRARKTRS